MPRRYPPEIRRQVVELARADIAEATGVRPSTVDAWLAGTRTPAGAGAERIVEPVELIAHLARVVDSGYIGEWLRKPVPALNGKTPLDDVKLDGARRVAMIVSALEESPPT